MKKATVDTQLCKGCRLCVDVCLQKAIVPLEDLNKKGYKIIDVIQERCNGCGFCYRICPDYVFVIDEESSH